MQATLPSSIQSLFWSDPHASHTAEGDATEIVHKVLALGSLEDIAWLKRTYDETTLRELFRSTPLPLYTPSSFHFASAVVLRLEEGSLDQRRYVKSVY